MSKPNDLTATSCMQIDVKDTTTHNICFERCENNKSVVLESQNLSSVGRFIMVNATVKDVCPNKQIAVGLKLYETTSGNKIIKGHKTFALKHTQSNCCDITLSNIHFVLPEEIAETCDKSNICNRRTFELETTSHYVDLTSVD